MAPNQAILTCATIFWLVSFLSLGGVTTATDLELSENLELFHDHTKLDQTVIQSNIQTWGRRLLGKTRGRSDSRRQRQRKRRFPEFDEVDQEFFLRAREAEAKRIQLGSAVGPPKVAFMFLSRGIMPLDAIWDRFFKGYEHLYSLYVMCPPGFEYNSSTTMATTFFGRQIYSNFKVSWAGNNVLRAERRLLAAALQEPRNSVFVLLSESCIPLWNLTYIHNYLTSSNYSYIASLGTDMRWEKQYDPDIPRDSWRKGSQWFSMIRDHALHVINDHTVFNTIIQRSTKFILNEHYVQTLISMKDPDRIERRQVTYVEWRPGNFFHPHTFTVEDMKQKMFSRIRSQSVTSPVKFQLYPGFKNSTKCTAGGKRTHCFLFARKFGIDTRHYLLHFAENAFFL